jgi:hypothetical protein
MDAFRRNAMPRGDKSSYRRGAVKRSRLDPGQLRVDDDARVCVQIQLTAAPADGACGRGVANY